MKITSLESLPVAYVSHDSKVEKKVLLKNGEVPHVTQLAVATLKPGEQASMHHHTDMTETFHFQSGSGEMEVDGKIFKVKAGTTVTVFPMEAHEIRNNGSKDLVVIYFGIV
ncbi:cupin domain-containing protein [Lobosporangium transversale]|uniref:Cupin domain-containing protein n=1 Tax=Lobosporangium transversale TaxID=64571 RepID=A0A1Y2GQW2_9FUNG|nr:cupin domain-containing protein [Lobosporangium transversale]ORZ19286.1 cupin domain-containing protein [Lobosporangium transversale]|eukprot:XP_021882454.1 cupin domain-containing protein [Lobosporangium transversale]